MAWAIVYYVKMGSREPQYNNKSTVPTFFLCDSFPEGAG